MGCGEKSTIRSYLATCDVQLLIKLLEEKHIKRLVDSGEKNVKVTLESPPLNSSLDLTLYLQTLSQLFSAPETKNKKKKAAVAAAHSRTRQADLAEAPDSEESEEEQKPKQNLKGKGRGKNKKKPASNAFAALTEELE